MVVFCDFVVGEGFIRLYIMYKSAIEKLRKEIINSKIPQLALTQKLYDMIAEDFNERSSGILSKGGDVLYVSGIEYDVQTAGGGVLNLFAPEEVCFYSGTEEPVDVTDVFLDVLNDNKENSIQEI